MLQGITLALRKDFVFWTSSTTHCVFTQERNGTIAYHFTFLIIFLIVPRYGTERGFLKRSGVNATSECSTSWNGTRWIGTTAAFPRERGLRVLSVLG